MEGVNRFFTTLIIVLTHLGAWFIFNILVGSMPLVVAVIRDYSGYEVVVGTLCFCFTAISAGIYTFIAKKYKEFKQKQDSLNGPMLFIFACSFIWAFFLLLITVSLPELAVLTTAVTINQFAVGIYLSSILLIVILNYNGIKTLILDDFTHARISAVTEKAEAKGKKMKTAFAEEGDL